MGWRPKKAIKFKKGKSVFSEVEDAEAERSEMLEELIKEEEQEEESEFEASVHEEE